MCSSKPAAPNRRTRRPPHRRSGFSLVEIMVVVVIIGMLAGAVTLKVTDYMKTARANRARSDIATIVKAVEQFEIQNSRYPDIDEGISSLPIRNKLDPWGHPYEYVRPGKNEPFEVICYGKDGREGGEGADADIYSWQLEEAGETEGS